MRSFPFVVLAVVVVALLVLSVLAPRDDGQRFEAVDSESATRLRAATETERPAPPVVLAEVVEPLPTPTREAVVEEPLLGIDWTGVKTMLEPGEELPTEAEIDATVVEMVCRCLGWRTDVDLPPCTLEFSCPVYVNGVRDLEMERVLFDWRGPKFGVTFKRTDGRQRSSVLLGQTTWHPRKSETRIGPLPPGLYRATPFLSMPSSRELRYDVVSGLEPIRFELTDRVIDVEHPIELRSHYSTVFGIELPSDALGRGLEAVARIVGPLGESGNESTSESPAVREFRVEQDERSSTHFTTLQDLEAGDYELLVLGYYVLEDDTLKCLAVHESFSVDPTLPSAVVTRAFEGCLWREELGVLAPRNRIPWAAPPGCRVPPRPPAMARVGVPDDQVALYSLQVSGIVRGAHTYVLMPGLTYTFESALAVAALNGPWRPVPPGHADLEPDPPFTFVAGPPGSVIERE